MYPVFESIKIDSSGLHNWSYHAARIQRTCMDLWKHEILLEKMMEELSQIRTNDCLKCKLFYNETSFKIENSTYHKRDIKKLILIEDNSIDYAFKFTNRNCFHRPEFMHDDTDIIYCKNGSLTDSSYSNLAFWNGQEWHTPNTFLLLGTKRALLLDQGLLIEKDISINNVSSYKKVSLINAMLELRDIEISIDNILFSNSH